MTAALESPLMTDPDLSLSNGRNLAAVSAGPIDGSLPDLAFGPDEASAAAAAALRETGARLRAPAMLPAPSPRLGAVREPGFAKRMTRLVDAPGCASDLKPGFEWAATASPLPVYPRAHLLAAAGSTAPGCRIIAATVLTPVEPAQVLAYYHARMRAAGYRDAASRADPVLLIEGVKGASRFAALIRPGEGATLVDLVSASN